MTVNVIITDMDGTFLDDTKKYNADRFQIQFKKLKERGIKFVVASGNQYYQLISFFPKIENQISFVAENGALVFDHGQKIFHGEFTHQESNTIIKELLKDKRLHFIVCGLKSAYVINSAPNDFVTLMSTHYHRLKRINDYNEINDTLFKFSLNLPNRNIKNFIKKLCISLNGIIKPVTSGFGFVDLIIPGLHKANGISRLLKRWNLSPQVCVGIGDSNNDAEMLKFVHYSFAMGNAIESIKILSRYHAEDNNHQGALNVIQAVIDNAPPFND